MIVEDCKTFPKSIEAKIIIDQALRSISSISALIAEGIGRGGPKELIRYLIMARGSIEESQNRLLKIAKLKWISSNRFEEYMEKLADTRSQTNALVGKLKKNIN